MSVKIRLEHVEANLFDPTCKSGIFQSRRIQGLVIGVEPFLVPST